MADGMHSLINACSSLSLSDSGSVYNKPGLALIVIDNDHCHAVVSPQGAHLVEFEQMGGAGRLAAPMLWLSPLAVFSPGKAIRGGIPICFPWFGPNSDDPNLPQHGFARTLNWQLSKTLETTDGSQLCFALASSDETLKIYHHPFSAEIVFKLGKKLSITLTVKNTGPNAMPVTWALHSYFPVTDTSRTTVPELLGSHFFDKTDNDRKKELTRNLDFSQHTDAVFTQSPDQITLVRPEGSLSIISKNAPTTITWNPGKGAQDFKDLTPASYKDFVCVERGAARSDGINLPPGESFSATMAVSGAAIQA